MVEPVKLRTHLTPEKKTDFSVPPPPNKNEKLQLRHYSIIGGISRILLLSIVAKYKRVFQSYTAAVLCCVQYFLSPGSPSVTRVTTTRAATEVAPSGPNFSDGVAELRHPPNIVCFFTNVFRRRPWPRALFSELYLHFHDVFPQRQISGAPPHRRMPPTDTV